MKGAVKHNTISANPSLVKSNKGKGKTGILGDKLTTSVFMMTKGKLFDQLERIK